MNPLYDIICDLNQINCLEGVLIALKEYGQVYPRNWIEITGGVSAALQMHFNASPDKGEDKVAKTIVDFMKERNTPLNIGVTCTDIQALILKDRLKEVGFVKFNQNWSSFVMNYIDGKRTYVYMTASTHQS